MTTIQDIRNLLDAATADLEGTIARLADKKAEKAATEIARHESDPARYCIHGIDLQSNWWTTNPNLCARCDRGFRNDTREHEYFARAAVNGAITEGTRYLDTVEKGETVMRVDVETRTRVEVTPQDMLDVLSPRLPIAN